MSRPEDRGPVVVRPPGATVPIPIGRDTDISKKAAECLETVASDLYDGDDLQYIGKTRLEAAVLSLARASTSSPDARTEFLDRVMGKPKQRVDTTSVTMDLTSYLQQLAKEDSEGVTDAEFRVSSADEIEERSPLLRSEMPEDKDEDGADSSLCFQ